jgi:DNA-binding NarL/FixJ family response regulator
LEFGTIKLKSQYPIYWVLQVSTNSYIKNNHQRFDDWSLICYFHTPLSSMSKRNILIINDHLLLREALSELLKAILISKVKISTAKGGLQAIEMISRDPEIQVVLLDLQLRDMSSIELIKSLRKKQFAGGILAMSQLNSQALINSAINSGVNGYLPMDSAPEDLVKAIEFASHSEFYDNEWAQEWKKGIPSTENTLAYQSLSPRECELVYYLKQGKSSKEIGSILSLSVRTIESYRKKLMRRTKSKNVVELISFIFESGLFYKQLKRKAALRSTNKTLTH